MQSRAASVLPRRVGWPASSAAMQHARTASSFIQQVMEQVKKDMENDEKSKKDWERVQQSTSRMRQQSRRQEENLRNAFDNMQSLSSSTSARLGEWKQMTAEKASAASRRLSRTVEQNESLKAARDLMESGFQSGATGSGAMISRTKEALGGGIDKVSSLFSYMGEEKAPKLKEWKASRDAAAAATSAKDSEDSTADGAAAGPGQPADGLVVSQSRSSSWDRFGAGLRDMPFLSNVFENPLFEQLFGESEIAASIREMKEIDPRFYLEDFAEDVEYVVAPHILENYLVGNQGTLERHCGEAAFNALNASIKVRTKQKLTLDTSILAGPKEFELKGAKLMEKGAPCFIWTFNAQQVNCLRDVDGEIIEGAIDDIRTVHYAMAITRHPDLAEQLDLEYPWQVSELAILGNQPCW